jgi:small-conductance mechanosensitive channel
VQNVKSYFIRRALNRAPKNCDKIKLINNICDSCILALLIIKILKYLSLDTDYAVNSLFAVGTTGGLIISLASQEVARNVMSGIEMASSSRFYTGDHVHFGDGTKGEVAAIQCFSFLGS